MTEHDHEPIPGLPGLLPKDERILWQGAPDWRVLARTAYHTRIVTGYFVLLAGWSLGEALARGVDAIGDLSGVGLTAGFGAIAVGLLNLLAWGAARTTLYTLTNRRIVFRVGIAFSKCINLPLRRIASVGLAVQAPAGFLLVAVAIEHGAVVISQHQAVGVRALVRCLLQLVRLAITSVVIAANTPRRLTTGVGRGDGEVQGHQIGRPR